MFCSLMSHNSVSSVTVNVFLSSGSMAHKTTQHLSTEHPNIMAVLIVWTGISIGEHMGLHVVQNGSLSDLKPMEDVWNMLGRCIGTRSSPPIILPEMQITLLNEWHNNLIQFMPCWQCWLLEVTTQHSRGQVLLWPCQFVSCSIST